MGLLDRFRRNDDPMVKLAKTPLVELREKRIELGMQLQQTKSRIDRLRSQFDEIIEKGQATSNENELKVLEKEAKLVQKEMKLRQDDFDGLNASLENLDNLILVREGVGDKPAEVQRLIDQLSGLSLQEQARLLQQKTRATEEAKVKAKERQEIFDAYTEAPSARPTEVEAESDIMRMMKAGREPSLAKAAKAQPKPAAKEASAQTEPAPEQKDTKTQTMTEE